MVVKEFQAVVLAGGRGTRLPELTGNKPKCLLRVGPFPMLFYPLHMLEKHGFQDATVIVIESEKLEIQQTIEKTPLKLRIEYATIPNDSDFGTADAIRHIKDKIKSDVLIVSGDTITNISLYPLFNKFREHDASVAILLAKGGMECDAKVPGPKTKHKPERDLIGIHPITNRLLFLASTSDFEEFMSLPGHLLRKNGHININSRLVDCHIYIMKKWTIDFLSANKELSTIKGELLPYIVKKQMSRPLTMQNENDKPGSMVNVNMKMDDIFNFVKSSKLKNAITFASTFNDTINNNPYNSDLIRCYAFEASKDSLAIRVNTTLAYCAANQKITTLWDKLCMIDEHKLPLISPSSTVHSTQMSSCAIGDNTMISEKTSLKDSVIGMNCQISPKVRISNSCIMNNVIVEERVIIEHSIICDKAVIKAGSIIKNCLIGTMYIVNEETKKENVHLTNADGFMEIDY